MHAPKGYLALKLVVIYPLFGLVNYGDNCQPKQNERQVGLARVAGKKTLAEVDT